MYGNRETAEKISDKHCAVVLACPLPSSARRMQAQLKHAAWEGPLKFLAMQFSGAFIITLWDRDCWDITTSHNLFEQPIICNIIMVMQLYDEKALWTHWDVNYNGFMAFILKISPDFKDLVPIQMETAEDIRSPSFQASEDVDTQYP
ncbi:hypothetical protein TURU_017289 [Turdus rufiventris]|nr:hypothetical protein TURU_017289 [Turdus rufiventris]